MRRSRAMISGCRCLLSLTLLAGCATQQDYSVPTFVLPATWDNANAEGATRSSFDSADAWWLTLHDPAIDALIDAALRSNPTLAEAAARVDEAVAQLAGDRAQRLPRLDLVANAVRDQSPSVVKATQIAAVRSNVASVGPSLSWELDLWGRVRTAADADRHRIEARDADAADARLAIAAQIADTVIALRACRASLDTRDRDIAAREIELGISRKRVSAGNAAPVDAAKAESNLASAQTDRNLANEQCVKQTDALVALSALRAAEIIAMVGAALPDQHSRASSPAVLGELVSPIPQAPAFVPALPACVLMDHPSVVASEREAAARWSEIAVARAERLPRVDLAALLSGQWLNALGTTASLVTWSLGSSLSAAVYDGGAGSAKVRLAQARYREAIATLDSTLRGAAHDIEDSLAEQQSAILRSGTSREAAIAASFTLRADEARWRAGAINLFELEDSRRQLRVAQDSAIAAESDRARAWVQLVRRTGSAFNPATTASPARAASCAGSAASRVG